MEEDDEDVHSAIERQLGEVGPEDPRRPLPQRPGRRRVPARRRRRVRGSRRAAPGVRRGDPRPRGGGGGDADARVHAPPARDPRHGRAPPARVGRDARARPRPVRVRGGSRRGRRRSAPVRSPARRCRCRRRPTPCGTRSTPSPTATSRSTTSTPCRPLQPPVAHRRGARALDDDGVRLCPAARARGDRLLDDAAQAQSGRGRAGTRQGRDRDRAPDRPARDAEVPPARLQPRPAGGQAAGVRRAGRRPRRARSVDGARGRARVDRERLSDACADPLLRATDAAEALVRAGVPFRDAHEQVAASVRAGTFEPAAAAPRLGNVAQAVEEARERWRGPLEVSLAGRD